MSKWLSAISAVRRGVTLTNAQTWRKTGTAVAASSAFLTALMGFALAQGWLGTELSPQTIMEISSLLVSVVFAVLSYLNVATDEAQGPKPKQNKTEPPGNPFLDGQ